MAHARVLLVHAGPAMPLLARPFGDFDAWFFRALSGVALQWTVVRPFTGEPLPDPRSFDAVLVTGSHASVRDLPPWMAGAARWMRQAVEGGSSLLGVCFGHQLLAHAFGARVVRNPRGFEVGTVEVELTAEGRADPLLGPLGPSLRVHQTHEDMVTELTSSIRLLAGNPWTPVQAIAVGERAWGVQFHPEMEEGAPQVFARSLGLEVHVERSRVGTTLLEAFVKRSAAG